MTTPGRSLAHRYAEGAGDQPVLLLLHGTGGGPDDLLGLARALSPGSAVLAPAGPVSENGMARWFRRLAEGVFDTEDVIARAHQIAGFIQEARDRYALGDRRMVAVGFSNGANIAAAVLLLRPDVLREAVLFAAMSPLPASMLRPPTPSGTPAPIPSGPPEMTTGAWSFPAGSGAGSRAAGGEEHGAPGGSPVAPDLAGTRVFLAGGEHDPMAPLHSAEQLVDALRQRSASVEIFRHPGGHEITIEAVRAAEAWLTGAKA